MMELVEGKAGVGEKGLEAGVGELVAVFGVDGFAGGEGDAVVLDADGLVDEAFEVHLDAAVDGVPEGAVGEVIEVEVGAEVAVEAGEDVFVEGRGDSGGVIVGGDERGGSFAGAGGEIDAEEERVAGFEVGAEVGEDGDLFLGTEVADAGADVEREDGVVGRAGDGEGFGGVVGDLWGYGDAGDVGGDGGGGFVEGGGADVDGLVEQALLVVGELA